MRFLPHPGPFPENNIVDLDLKDKKILFHYGQNARQPLTNIAKQVGLSVDTVAYRLKKLHEERVIYKARTLIDVTRLGYESYHVFLKLKNPTEEIEGNLIKGLCDLPYIRAVLKFYGCFDLEIAVIAKTVQEFDNILSKIVSLSKHALSSYEVLIITKNYFATTFPKSFLKMRKQVPFNLSETPSLDKTDLNLLKIIRDDAQQSLLSLSSKLKISPDTVKYRLKKLEKSLILGYSPVVNYSSINYHMRAILITIFNLDEQKEKLMQNWLQTNEHVLWAVKTVGKYNLILYVCTHEESTFQETASELRSLFPGEITNFDTLSSVAEYKYTLAPDCLFS